MTKFNISILQKKKMVDMIKGLLPKVKGVRFKKDGIVSIRTGLFKRYKLHISELCVSILPIKLNDLRTILDETAYDYVYNPYSFTVANMLNYNSNANSIIDYLYSEYSLIKFNIKRVDISTVVEIPQKVERFKVSTSYLPTISSLSFKYVKSNFKFLGNRLVPKNESFSLYIQDMLLKLKSMLRCKRSRKRSNQLRMLLQVNLK